MDRVSVLMSTYNGERYLREQLDSILTQRDIELSIHIRDDGSTDNTVSIIKEYSKNHNNIYLVTGDNIGYKRSFMELVYSVGESDFYAFSDQDDVWDERKLIVMTDKLKRHVGIPALCYSEVTFLDEELHSIVGGHQKQGAPPTKMKNLFQTFSQGSAMVFNHELMKLVKMYRIKQDLSHDFWIPLLCNFLGVFVYVDEPYTKYRKHNDAVTVQDRKHYWKKLMDGFLKGEHVENPAMELIEGYGELLSAEDKELLNKISSYNKNVLSVVRNSSIGRNTIKGTVLLKLAFLTGRVNHF